jgi:hypothetical protein
VAGRLLPALSARTTQPMAVPPQTAVGSTHVIHLGAFSQLHTATTTATHMASPTTS